MVHVWLMPTRASRTKVKKAEDINSAAHGIVAYATGGMNDAERERQLRTQAASILSKLGASKGGKARASKLSKKARSLIAKKAAKARWSK